MRLLIAILFIINILLLIFTLTSKIPNNGKESNRQWDEISPEKIRKIDNLTDPLASSSNQTNPNNLPSAPAIPPTIYSAANPSSTNTSTNPPPSNVAKNNDKSGNCTAWKGLTKRDEEKLIASLGGISGISSERITSPRGSTWLVYVPLTGTLEETQANLAAKGIRDGIRAQNQVSGAEIISLGFYATEGAAEVRVREVTRLGISEARIGPRQKGGGYSVQIKANTLAELLKASNAVAKKMPNLDVSECN